MVERRAKDGNGAEYVYRVRFWDKIRALELLGRHVGMFSDREVTREGGELLVPDMTDEELFARLLAKRRPPLSLTAVPRLVASNPTPEPRAAAALETLVRRCCSGDLGR